MKTMKLIELERQRLALFDEARALFAEITANTDQKILQAAETKHDAAMRSIDQINLDIAEEQFRADDESASKEAREARRPGGYCPALDIIARSGDHCAYNIAHPHPGELIGGKALGRAQHSHRFAFRIGPARPLFARPCASKVIWPVVGPGHSSIKPQIEWPCSTSK